MTAQKLTVIKTIDGVIHSDVSPNILMTHDAFGDLIETYHGSQIHCESGPAMVLESGEEIYYCDGHRLTYDQYCERIKVEPTYYNMPSRAKQRVWRSRATHKIHRIDGPAIETSDGSCVAWLINGQYHRVDGPAKVTVNNLAVEEMYYYNGKLHNPDGPAKINFLTNRKSYYLNGTRLSKRDFMQRQRTRKRMRGAVAKRVAYNAYFNAYVSFREILDSKSYKLGTSSQIVDLINDNSLLRSGIDRRAASLGIYHAISKEVIDPEEFTSIYDSIEDASSPLYVVDAGDNNSLYEIYLATFCINRCDQEAVFTTLTSDTEVQGAISSAIDNSLEQDLPTDYNKFFTVTEKVIDDVDAPAEGILSWSIPLAIAAGVGILGEMYKKKKTVNAKVKEQAWAMTRKI